MVNRQFDLLKTIVEAYIERAEPIGSQLVVREYHFSVSSATVRNQMVDLEDEGYIEQPHTSAGRIPTEKGYQWYVDHAMEVQRSEEVLQRLQETIDEVMHQSSASLKRIAQCIVEMTGEAVLVSQPPDTAFTIGLSRLFAQPEFAEIEMIRGVTQTIDRIDEIIDVLEQSLVPSEQVNVLIGKNNPFGERLSTLMLTVPTRPPVSIGLVGPMRMPYGRNMGIMRALQECFAPSSL